MVMLISEAKSRRRKQANVTASRLALKTERKLRVISEDAYVVRFHFCLVLLFSLFLFSFV